jgi:hypothetical protein
MIMLNVVNAILQKTANGATLCEETSRILVHSMDILQVYEEHSKRDTHTYAIVKSPSGTTNTYRIRETIDCVQRMVLGLPNRTVPSARIENAVNLLHGATTSQSHHHP